MGIPKSKTWVLFPFINLIKIFLLFTIFITKSTSIPYSKYCNNIVQETQATQTQLPTNNFLQLNKAVYSLGFQNPQFNFNPNSSQTVSFTTLKVYKTKSENIVKVDSFLNLNGPEILDYFSGEISRRGLRLVKVRPPRFMPSQNSGAGFRLSGFWDSGSGKLCMVGSGSVSALNSVDVVFNLNYPNYTVLDTSLINGTLQCVTDSRSGFKPVSILGVSGMGYSFSYIDKESKDGGFSGYDGMENVSLSLPDAQMVNGSGICSVITWGLRFELDYSSYDCKNVSCSFGTVGDETFPRFMSIKVVDCLEDGKVRYILQFSNSSFDKGLSFYPLTSLIAEGKWDKEKKRLALVACQLFGKWDLSGCSIRVAFSFPLTLSLKHRSSIVGKMWSTKTKNLGNVSFYSPANLNTRLKDSSYEYLEFEKVGSLCKKSIDSKGKKGTYPDEKSPNLRFDMLVRNKKGQMAYGYASPLYIRDRLYSPFAKIESESEWKPRNGHVNVSYVMSFTTRDEFKSGGKAPASKMIEISAEGVFNTKNGVVCMLGCKHMPYEKFQRNGSLDCELVINVNYSPLNGKDAGMVHGTIQSMRKKSDPLYFEPLEFGTSSITTIQARESIWRMDLEITMVLISNTLACIFIGLQLFHAKKNPEILPFISVVMLVVLTLAHMIPLVLNFEAIFMLNRKQSLFLGTDQWLEVNEVLVRVITMVAFLLQFRLLQLTWSSRNDDLSHQTLWVSDKKVICVSLPLYIISGLIAWLTHSLQSSHTKTHYLGPRQFHAHETFWDELKSYVGLVLDAFLVPQIMFNLFSDTHEMALAPSFYIGSTMVRLLPHVYDLYRTHSSSWFYDKIYANPGMDYYSTMWDVFICCGGTICVLVVYVQQRFGGRSLFPKRFRDSVLYQKVPVTTREQQIF
uniref:uncharacterized protein LOC122590497 n=1 Tax=Erigeron canadensis TaxID=72917 RepID=UPI001CB9871F|nr:uncharacterized protein LOC122590497 [Erigeron canadensis]